MICPYCGREHPDGTDICPDTGKPLGQSGLAESNQGVQPVIQAEAKGTPHKGGIPTAMEHVPLELTPPPVGQGEEPHPEPGLLPPLIETPSAEAGSAVTGRELSAQAVAGSFGLVKTNKPRNRIRWVIGGCVGIPLIILLLLVLVALIDPFNLHVWGRITGQYDAAAEVMPANTGLYLGINIGNAWLTRADRTIAPFIPMEQSNLETSGLGFLAAPINPKNAQQAGPFDELLQNIEDETGIKIPEDISPWVGQYLGIGAVEFEDTGYGSQIPTGWMIAVEVRSLSQADKFLGTLQSNMTDLQDISFERQTYKGINIYVQKTDGDQNAISFGRSGRMLLGASTLDTLKKAIDQQPGQALSQEQDYNGLINLRPRDWSASLYINHDLVGNLTEDLMGSTVSPAMPLINPYASSNWTGLLVNASAIKQGVRLDLYTDFTVTVQAGTDTEQLQSMYIPPEQVIQVLPQDTVIYLANNRFDLVIDSLLATALTDETEQSDFLGSFEQSLGFSLRDDLLDQLTGQWAIYAVPSTRGLLPSQTNLNLAVSLLVQTEGDLNLQPITNGLTKNGMLMGMMLNNQERDGITYYELGSFDASNPLVAFGTGNGYFTLGTDLESLQVSSSEDNSLVKSANYQIALNALPSKMKPAVYMDLENLFANLREGMEASERESFNESISFLQPIRIIASANRFLQPNMAHTSIVIILAEK